MGWFGTGEARLCSLVSKDQAYKPMVKSSGAQRESDGVVVPRIAVSNAAGGKGPDFGHAEDTGTCKGMAGTARPNYPVRRQPDVDVRRLQNRLWAAAKQSSGRRFHALYDRIYRSDVLWEAWERVRANRGAAGVDEMTVAAVEDYGVHRRPCVGWRFQSQTARSGRWVFRRCVIGCASRQPRSFSNRFSRPISCL
jgi:hypothetical protein